MLAGGIVGGAMFIASIGLFIGAVAPHMPPVGAGASERAAFYAAMAASPLYALTRLLIMTQLAPLALFFGGLYPLLRRAEGGSGALASAVFAAGILGSLLAPVVELVEGHLLLGLSSAGADPIVAVGFDGMTPVAFGLGGMPQLVVLLGAALLLGAERSTPRWIHWLGYTAALVGLLGVGVIVLPDLFFLGLLSALLYKVWMVALSVALLRRSERVRPALGQPAIG